MLRKYLIHSSFIEVSRFAGELPFFLIEYLRIMIKTRGFKKKVKKLGRGISKVNVLANGPSLESSIPAILKTDGVVFAVNSFPTHWAFTVIKPKYLCFVDSMYWRPAADLIPEMRTAVESTHDALNMCTWDLSIFVPLAQVKSIAGRIKNPRIKIIGFDVVYFDFASAYLLTALARISAPPPRKNVAVTALYISALLGPKSINIYGLDMDRVHDFNTDQTTNRSYLNYRLFNNDENCEYLYVGKLVNSKSKTMYVKLDREASSFKWFAYVSELCAFKGLKIENHSAASLVDSIARPKSP